VFVFQHVVLDAEKNKTDNRKQKKEPKNYIELVIKISVFKKWFSQKLG